MGSFYSCKKIVQPPESELPSSFKNIYINGTAYLNISEGTENVVTEASGYSIKAMILDSSLIITGWGNVNLKMKECDTIFVNDNSIINGLGSTKCKHVTLKIGDVPSLAVNNINLADSMDVILNGKGTYTFSGITNKLNVYVNADGSFSGYNLVTKNCKARINSNGNAEVFVSDTLTGIINGDGTIYYKGNPSFVMPVIISGNGQLIKN